MTTELVRLPSHVLHAAFKAANGVRAKHKSGSFKYRENLDGVFLRFDALDSSLEAVGTDGNVLVHVRVNEVLTLCVPERLELRCRALDSMKCATAAVVSDGSQYFLLDERAGFPAATPLFTNDPPFPDFEGLYKQIPLYGDLFSKPAEVRALRGRVQAFNPLLWAKACNSAASAFADLSWRFSVSSNARDVTLVHGTGLFDNQFLVDVKVLMMPMRDDGLEDPVTEVL